MRHLPDRREFMAGLAGAGGALAAGSWLSGIGHAQGRAPARAVAQRTRSLADMDRRLLGAFLEHLGRAIYTGVYEPGSKLADGKGFRRDVLAEGILGQSQRRCLTTDRAGGKIDREVHFQDRLFGAPERPQRPQQVTRDG